MASPSQRLPSIQKSHQVTSKVNAFRPTQPASATASRAIEMQLSGSPEQDDIIIDQDESSTNQPLQAYYENKVHLEFLAERGISL